MMPMPPSMPPSQPPMPSVPPMPSDGMACPHCAKPVMLQKPPMGDKQDVPPAKAKGPVKGDKQDKPMPAKKKNAANAPMDELKEVLKAGKPNGND